MSTPYNISVQIKNALINALLAEQHPGGKLATVVSIAGTAFNEVAQYPYVSADLIRTKEAFIANHRTRVTMDFAITVSCKSTGLLIDCYKQRDLLVDSGDGSGIQPIIREIYYTLLGGLIEKIEISDTILLSNVDTAKGEAFTAYYCDALTVVTCSQSISI